MTLVEIGPRFCMTVIRLFEGSFGGSTVFENPEFVSPNMIRAAHRREKATKYNSRLAAQSEGSRRQGIRIKHTQSIRISIFLFQCTLFILL
jgi:ribosome biogenesis protein BRX1